MNLNVTKLAKVSSIVAVGVVICAAGIYVGDTDDAPGAALLGTLFLIGSIFLAVHSARRKM